MSGHSHLAPEREASVAQTAAQLGAGRSVLLFGATGIGKTYIGSAIMRRLAGSPRPWRIRINSDGSSFIAGALGPDDDPSLAHRGLTPSTIDEIETLLASPARPVALHVDDAHLFDERHIRWLVSLVERSTVAVLVAVNSDDGIGDAATAVLSRLWVDEIADRIDLEVLDRVQTDSVIASLAGGKPIDLASRIGIYRASGGLPLLIRELVRELLGTGLVTGSPSTFIYPLPPTPSKRLVDIVWHRLRHLTDDERTALVMLARLEGLPIERANRYVGRDMVRRLVRSGLILQHETTGAIRPAHRIEPEVVLAVTGDVQLARTSLDVARLMRDDLRAGVRLTARETVMLAETLIGAEQALDVTAEEEDDLAAVLLGAANISLANGTIYTGLSFARASRSLRPSVRAIVAESGCLRAMGNLPAAVAVLDEAERLVSSAQDREVLARWRVRFGSWIGAAERADAGEEASARIGLGHDHRSDDGLAELALAMDQVMAMEWDAAGDTSWVAATNSEASQLTRLHALEIHLVCAARAGRGAQLDRAIALGDSLSADLRDGDAWGEIDLRTGRAAYFGSRAIAQITAGRSMAELSGELDEEMDDALTRHEFTRVSVISALVGYMALCRSDPDAAEVELRLARDRWMVIPDARWQVWIVALHAESLMSGGRVDEAHEELAQTERDAPAGSRMRDFAAEWSRAESGSALVEVSGAGLVPPFGETGAMAPSAELSQMVARIERGERAEPMMPRAIELRESTDLELLRGMADVVIGTADQDVPTLQTAARELANVSYFGFAALAETRAASLLAASGQRMATATSESQAREYRRSQRRRDPDGAALSIDLAALTTREREIVELIAVGRTNREVAEQLFLSVRTVESHFYQARMKLGAVSRQELMRRIAATPRT